MDELAQLEVLMGRQRLQVWPRTADSEILALPSLIEIFRCLVGSTVFPTQEAFLRAVVSEARDLPELSVRARASRAYPAFVRQLHFGVAIRTRTPFKGVHWIPSLDMLGIDLLILHEGFALGVALSIKTDVAAAWQIVKRGRHPTLTGLKMIEVNVDPDLAPKVGPFWVHPLSDVWFVQDAMDALMAGRREVALS